MERVFGAATQWVEVQKQLERVEAELSAQRKRLGISETSSGGVKAEDKMEGVTTSAGDTGRSSSVRLFFLPSCFEQDRKN